MLARELQGPPGTQDLLAIASAGYCWPRSPGPRDLLASLARGLPPPRPRYLRQFCQITGTALQIWQITYRQFCQITGTAMSTDRQFCQITVTLLHIQAIVLLACFSIFRQFCQNTGTFLHIQTILPNHLSKNRQFKSALAHCPQTGNSVKSALAPQAILSNHWHTSPRTCNSAKSLAHCPQTGNSAKSLAQAILPNHWHAPPHTGNSTKSLLALAHCP